MAETLNTYVHPVSLDQVSATVKDTISNSHSGAYKGSVDFAVPLDTVVRAAADGVIRRVRMDSERYGDTPEFGPDANYITIEHAHAELSEYLHLAKDSVVVKVGDLVRAGQAIAKTGLSGWMHAPHLHFMVYKKVNEPADFQCLDVNFVDAK